MKRSWVSRPELQWKAEDAPDNLPPDVTAVLPANLPQFPITAGLDLNETDEDDEDGEIKAAEADRGFSRRPNDESTPVTVGGRTRRRHGRGTPKGATTAQPRQSRSTKKRGSSKKKTNEKKGNQKKSAKTAHLSPDEDLYRYDAAAPVSLSTIVLFSCVVCGISMLLLSA